MENINWPRLSAYVACAALPAVIAAIKAGLSPLLMVLEVILAVAVTLKAYFDTTHSEISADSAPVK
jgi:hypothetical protein